MNMTDAVDRLKTSRDPEAQWIGAHLEARQGDYLSELKKGGLTDGQCARGFVRFCEKLLAAAGNLDPLPFPDYREDVVEEMGNLARAEYKEAC